MEKKIKYPFYLKKDLKNGVGLYQNDKGEFAFYRDEKIVLIELVQIGEVTIKTHTFDSIRNEESNTCFFEVTKKGQTYSIYRKGKYQLKCEPRDDIPTAECTPHAFICVGNDTKKGNRKMHQIHLRE